LARPTLEDAPFPVTACDAVEICGRFGVPALFCPSCLRQVAECPSVAGGVGKA